MLPLRLQSVAESEVAGALDWYRGRSPAAARGFLSVTSEEVLPGVVLDLDDQGALVGIDIDHASSRLELPLSGTRSVPFEAVGG